MLTPKAVDLIMKLQTMRKEDWDAFPLHTLYLIRETLAYGIRNLDKRLATNKAREGLSIDEAIALLDEAMESENDN